MQYTWGSHGGLATLTLAHINVQKIVFVWSVNPAKKTADSPPLSGAGCQKKKKNQEASWRSVGGMCELLHNILWKWWEESGSVGRLPQAVANLTSSGPLPAPHTVRACVCVRGWASYYLQGVPICLCSTEIKSTL